MPLDQPAIAPGCAAWTSTTRMRGRSVRSRGGTAGAGTVDTVNGTINIGVNSGIYTGDLVIYHQNGGGSIGLTNLGTYYARVQGGLLSLYDSRLDALGNDTTGLVALNASGSGIEASCLRLASVRVLR